jgi:hypothetical protein
MEKEAPARPQVASALVALLVLRILPSLSGVSLFGSWGLMGLGDIIHLCLDHLCLGLLRKLVPQGAVCRSPQHILMCPLSLLLYCSQWGCLGGGVVGELMDWDG